MKWVTRSHVHVDRVACPCSSPASSIRSGVHVRGAQPRGRRGRIREATPFDVPGADLGHRDGKCTFEVIMERYELKDRALQRMAKIVHAADMSDFDQDPLAAGLEAVAVGYSIRFPTTRRTSIGSSTCTTPSTPGAAWSARGPPSDRDAGPARCDHDRKEAPMPAKRSARPGPPVVISGVIPKLSMKSGLGPPRTECAAGAMMAFAERLWVSVTSPASRRAALAPDSSRSTTIPDDQAPPRVTSARTPTATSISSQTNSSSARMPSTPSGASAPSSRSSKSACAARWSTSRTGAQGLHARNGG